MKPSPRQTMDFFEHQDRAKARTRRFIILYTITVIIIVVATSTITAAVPFFNTPRNIHASITVWLITAAITTLMILGASANRIAQLKGGGSSIARALGGIRIDPSTRDPQQRQLLNIVDEMAIASGVPAPPVYIMQSEKGINAFAAGYTSGDAVIGVTQGCIDGLKRDELQGVIAHEFSHILNGDMKLNIKMIGFLAGFLLLASAGQLLLHATFRVGRTSRNKEGAAATASLGIFAIALLILGSVGAFAAQLIQSAVSKQREFLADASAVQFTRNPDGIANALRRLGSRSKSTRVRHPRASETNHMFFGESFSTMSFSKVLASHPPLKDRIKRINPQWDGTFLPSLLPEVIPAHDDQGIKHQSVESARERLERHTSTNSPLDQLGQHAALLTPLLALSGNMTPSHIDHARDIIQSIPAPLKEAAHDISSSRAVVYALLLDTKDAKVHTDQLHQLRKHADPAVSKLTEKLATHATGLKPELRLPLLDMTLASLAHLSDRQHQTFQKNISALINMDSSVTLFEWTTIKVLTRHLNQRFAAAPRARTQYYALNKLTTEVSVLLSIIARTDTPEDSQAAESITLANTAFKPQRSSNRKSTSKNTATKQPFEATLLPKNQCTLDQLEPALQTLNTATPRLKRSIIHACALAAAHDHTITTTEAELLRAIADTLGVPIPPLLPNQQLA